jgi:predicted CopG family antitoxin
MSVQITVSDEIYQALQKIGSERGQTPESVIDALVEDYLSDPDADIAAQRYTTYHSTEEFMRALGADEEMLAEARERDAAWEAQIKE